MSHGKTSVPAVKELQKSVPTTVTHDTLSWIVNPHPTGCPGWPNKAPSFWFSVTVLAVLLKANTAAHKSAREICFITD